jgi:hypothetical protein
MNMDIEVFVQQSFYQNKSLDYNIGESRMARGKKSVLYNQSIYLVGWVWLATSSETTWDLSAAAAAANSAIQKERIFNIHIA